MFKPYCFMLAMLVFTSPLAALAQDVAPLLAGLASDTESERATALEALQKLGAEAKAPLIKAEADEKMNPRQLLLVRRIIGDPITAGTPLKLIDPALLTPFGADKAKGIAGNPNLLVNREAKLVVMNGEFVLEQGLLEYLLVVKHPNAKTHETVAAVYAVPRDICYALLACNYTYAGEVTEDGKIDLPREAGIMISIEYEWEPVNAGMGGQISMDNESSIPIAEYQKRAKRWVRVPIEYFAWNPQTEKTMKRSPFAFTGSKFEKGEDGKMEFMADIEKSIVALKFDSYALMNTLLDTKNINPRRVEPGEAAGYVINRYTIPARGTKCRVVFEPWSGGVLTPEELKDTLEVKGDKPAAAPQK